MVAVKKIFDEVFNTDHKVITEESSKDILKSYGVKVLGDGEITKKLTILVPISKSAAKKIEKAGGKVVRQESRENKKANEKKKDK